MWRALNRSISAQTNQREDWGHGIVVSSINWPSALATPPTFWRMPPRTPWPLTPSRNSTGGDLVEQSPGSAQPGDPQAHGRRVDLPPNRQAIVRQIGGVSVEQNAE
jgi:hypothetical protein